MVSSKHIQNYISLEENIVEIFFHNLNLFLLPKKNTCNYLEDTRMSTTEQPSAPFNTLAKANTT